MIEFDWIEFEIEWMVMWDECDKICVEYKYWDWVYLILIDVVGGVLFFSVMDVFL